MGDLGQEELREDWNGIYDEATKQQRASALLVVARLRERAGLPRRPQVALTPAPRQVFPWALRRWAMMVGSLLLVLYFTVGASLAGDPGFDHRILSDRTWQVQVVRAGPARDAGLQVGDVVVAVDGRDLTLKNDWHWPIWLWLPHQYTLQRGDTLTIANTPINIDVSRVRALPLLVALSMWGVGLLMVALARVSEITARHVGTILLMSGVALGSLVASVHGVPGGLTGWEILMPIIAVEWVKMSFFPQLREQTQVATRLLLVLRGMAFGVVGMAALEYFYPWAALAGAALRILVGLCFSLHISILATRYRRAAPSLLKRQLHVLVATSGIASAGVILLILMQSGLAVGPLGLFEVPLVLIALLPAAYGYVTYRSRYLSLDIAATRGLTWAALGLAALISYSLFYGAVQRLDLLAALEPIPSAVFAALLLSGFVPAAYGPTARAAQWVLALEPVKIAER